MDILIFFQIMFFKPMQFLYNLVVIVRFKKVEQSLVMMINSFVKIRPVFFFCRFLDSVMLFLLFATEGIFNEVYCITEDKNCHKNS